MTPDIRSHESSNPLNGTFMARVVSNVDAKYMGTLEVQLLRDIGNKPFSGGSTFHVKYLSPFYGSTGSQHLGSNNAYDDTQKSYGMWMVPPDTGTTVVVTFINGSAQHGFWLGCVPDENMNFMVPGLASTEMHNAKATNKQVVAEYNRQLASRSETDATKIKKPVHPFQQILDKQGLDKDETRGLTTSSARRESPSAVFGISTPGPVDRRPGAPRGVIGKAESKVTNAHVSRLGGTTFVMDDGDDSYLRKTHASDGPPEYGAVEDGGKGLPDIPHNELVRIRTRTGHQILLHNSEDLIYIANSRGTAWIELTSNGKIDIWAADSISMHTAGDFNVTADKNINMTAGGDINLFSGANFKATAAANYELKAGADGKLTVGGSSNIVAGGPHKETASQIHMNGPSASSATSAIKAPRVPTAEPWNGHENLHGGGLTSIIDTFKRVGTGKK